MGRLDDPAFAGNLVGNLEAVAAWPATGEKFGNRVNQGERLVLAKDCGGFGGWIVLFEVTKSLRGGHTICTGCPINGRRG